MALQRNSAEGGTNGTTVTTVNSGGGSGNAFTQVTVAGAPTYTFSNNASAHGSLSYRITGISGDTAKLYLGAGNSTSAACRCYFYLNSLPGSSQTIITIQNTSYGVSATVNLSSANKLTISDGAGTIQYTATAALSAGKWYRLELQIILGTTTGTFNFQYYSGDSTTAIETSSSGTANTGTANFLRAEVGKQNSATTLDVNFDDIAYDDTTSTPIGPYSTANIPPTCSAGSDQTSIEPYATVSLAGTDSDSDGTVTTRTWRQISGSPTVTLSGTGAVRTYPAPGTIAGISLVFGYRVTDNGGAQSTESTVTHTILSVTERAVIGGVEVPVQTEVVSGGGLV